MNKLNWLEYCVKTDIPLSVFNTLFKGCQKSISVMCRLIIKKHYDSLSELEQMDLIKIYDGLKAEQIKRPHR
jgi:hypothetical protein